MEKNPKPKKIAIIGSGISGLATAFILAEAGHHVELFEKENEIGMDAHGVSGISNCDPNTRVDVPLRVFSRTYYPNLVALYHLIGTKIVDADYSFSCSIFTRDENKSEDDQPLFGYNRYGWLPLPQLASFKNVSPSSWKDSNFGLLCQLVRMLARAPSYVSNKELDNITLLDFMLAKGYTSKFLTCILFPMLSVVCTCSYESVGNYPASVALNYLAQHGIFNLPWRRTCQCRVIGGVRKVARTLAERASAVHLGVKISSVELGDNQSKRPCINFENQKGEKKSESFDEVVLATQAHQNINLIKDAPSKLDKALRSFRYERSRVVLHRDKSLMPTSSKQWSPLNILIQPRATMPMCTVLMHLIDSSVDKTVLQTWNPLVEPDPKTIVADSQFDRPVVSLESAQGMNDLEDCQGQGGLWFVGAYALFSVPLLENGVESAIRVASRLGAPCPWKPTFSSSTKRTNKEDPMSNNKVSSSGSCCSMKWATMAVAVSVIGIAIHNISKRKN